MDKLIEELLQKGLGNYIDRSRDALIWNDEIYQKCSSEEGEAEQKCMDSNLTKEQRQMLKNYVSDIRATEHRYADISYMAGIRDTVMMLVSLKLLKGVEEGEGMAGD